MQHKILIVCTGNICRSPLAATLLAEVRPDLEVQSAGLAALVGYPVDEVTAKVAETRAGLSMPAHTARQFTAAIGRGSDLILVMEDLQRQRIAVIAPELSGRTFLLTRWTTGADIVDPYRRSAAIYAGTHDAIATAVAGWATRIPQARRQRRPVGTGRRRSG